MSDGNYGSFTVGIELEDQVKPGESVKAKADEMIDRSGQWIAEQFSKLDMELE